MVMAVSFERYGRLYYLDPGPHTPRVGDKVLVPTDDGPEVAECVWAPQLVPEDIGGLPLCEGIATDADLERDEKNRVRRADARVTAKRLIRQHDLPMKVVGIDFVDRRADVDQLVIVYFSAPHRVDFRELVRDLARALRARIELRQVGARDEARLQGGIGPCGRDLCCATFLKDFEPVSVRMAKDQDLPLNPLKISGACGRLMCCLKYEHPLYQEFNAKARTTVPSPRGVSTGVPVAGAFALNSWYSGCSYFRQHISRPQAPEIFSGFSGRSCSLAIRTLTGSKSFRNVAQHRSRPHGPIPPCSRASSRAPTWRSSIRARRPRARSRTSSRKSTRWGAEKYTMTSWSTSGRRSTKSMPTTFIGRSCWRISRFAVTRASARRTRFFSSRSRSASVAMPSHSGSPPMSSGTSCGAHTHSATSGPSSVGTSTLSPTRGVCGPGSR